MKFEDFFDYYQEKCFDSHTTREEVEKSYNHHYLYNMISDLPTFFDETGIDFACYVGYIIDRYRHWLMTDKDIERLTQECVKYSKQASRIDISCFITELTSYFRESTEHNDLISYIVFSILESL
jgi:hypothetical protein